MVVTLNACCQLESLRVLPNHPVDDINLLEGFLRRIQMLTLAFCIGYPKLLKPT